LSQAYPAVLQEKLQIRFRDSEYSIQVINAGVGGSTSASGPSRLRWHLRAKPDLIIIALGANDMLRGVPPSTTETHLRSTIKLALGQEIPVILAGMKVPPNYGSAYRAEFEALFPKLAQEFRVPLVPFLLKGIAGVRELNLEDGIHPNEEGQKRIAELVEPFITKWINTKKARQSR
ncbi:MAG: arylesterase, partial [Bdellovibrionales bacterium]|nr:arylesterase [Bdellovibrionales bacterium]